MSGQTWWWLSFTDPEREPGTQFLGVAVVRAAGPAGAIGMAHLLGCNPGGEVSVVGPIPDDHVPPPEYRERLLDRPLAEQAAEF